MDKPELCVVWVNLEVLLSILNGNISILKSNKRDAVPSLTLQSVVSMPYFHVLLCLDILCSPKCFSVLKLY